MISSTCPSRFTPLSILLSSYWFQWDLDIGELQQKMKTKCDTSVCIPLKPFLKSHLRLAASPERSLLLPSQPSLLHSPPFQVLVPFLLSLLGSAASSVCLYYPLLSPYIPHIFVISSYVNKLSLKYINLSVPFVSCRDPCEYESYVHPTVLHGGRKFSFLWIILKNNMDVAVSPRPPGGLSRRKKKQ